MHLDAPEIDDGLTVAPGARWHLVGGVLGHAGIGPRSPLEFRRERPDACAAGPDFHPRASSDSRSMVDGRIRASSPRKAFRPGHVGPCPSPDHFRA
eukprot:1059090-Pyramimonas_sp.AAC.2